MKRNFHFSKSKYLWVGIYITLLHIYGEFNDKYLILISGPEKDKRIQNIVATEMAAFLVMLIEVHFCIIEYAYFHALSLSSLTLALFIFYSFVLVT